MGHPLLSLMRCATVGPLPPVHPAEQETPPWRLPRPPARGPAFHRRVRVRYFYPNLASTSVGSHSTAATSSSPPTSSRPSSKPTRKPPTRKSNRVLAESNKATQFIVCAIHTTAKGVLIGHPFFCLFVRRTTICVRPLSPFYVGSICLLCANSNLLKFTSIHKTS